jgi:4-carboxymuconolactone decarboxylase
MDPGDTMSEAPRDARAAGMAKMEEVYGFSVDPDTVEGPFVDVTVDHLFGAVWTREALDLRDRRMVTIGVLAALGQAPLLEIQFRAALERGELSEEQARELVLHLAHYIGWPLTTGVNAAAEKIIAQRRKAAATAEAAPTEES